MANVSVVEVILLKDKESIPKTAKLSAPSSLNQCKFKLLPSSPPKTFEIMGFEGNVPPEQEKKRIRGKIFLIFLS
jgi:hypothetical protein